MHVLIATTNPGKVREFRDILGDSRMTWTDLSAHPGTHEPEENGPTFRANAMIKAAYYARLFGVWALADDSGLEVDALGGKPGVHSARWAEMNGITIEAPADRPKRDAANRTLLIDQLRALGKPAPGESNNGWGRFEARFVCALALADPLGRIAITTLGNVPGVIIEQPRGTGGFGYDPHFLIEGKGRTTAELPAEEKHAISHRGAALRGMKRLMDELFSPAPVRNEV